MVHAVVVAATVVAVVVAVVFVAAFDAVVGDAEVDVDVEIDAEVDDAAVVIAAAGGPLASHYPWVDISWVAGAVGAEEVVEDSPLASS